MDEGFHNVLSAICSATLGYCGVRKRLIAVQSVMISFTSDKISVLWRWIL